MDGVATCLADSPVLKCSVRVMAQEAHLFSFCDYFYFILSLNGVQ